MRVSLWDSTRDLPPLAPCSAASAVAVLAYVRSTPRATGAFSGSFMETIGSKATTFSFAGAILLPKGATVGQAGGTCVRGDHTGEASITR